mmetsp:Transcript_17049/g.48007  ORF Transcript_17049/g.48007 Transcript_17049/m.48007 type:complete len:241 (+) Transcript_17049:1308-2030(+)
MRAQRVSPIPETNRPRALADTSRVSGMGSSSTAHSRSRRRLRYGSKSSTAVSLVMLPTMREASFLVAVRRSRSPHSSTGTTRASDGGSITWMNVVPRSLLSAFSVCVFGSTRASMRASTCPWISWFWMTPPMPDSARRAAFSTSSWLSTSTCCRRGTICGRHLLSIRGAQYAMVPSSSQLPRCVRQFLSSNALRIAGSTSLMPAPVSPPMSSLAVSMVARRTSALLSPKHCSRSGRTTTT